MQKDAKIYVAGHCGLVGSALVRYLISQGYTNLVKRTSSELNLCDQRAVEEFFSIEKPEFVFLAAGKVGGVWANNAYPADFIYKNIMIEANVIHAAYQASVKKLLFLGSTCIYPKLAPQPLREDYLLTGALESTNEWYAVAKIAGIKICQAYRIQHGCDFISAMPTNLYGPGDNFDLETSHVLPALIRKFHEAKQAGSPAVSMWGTGSPRREFCHVDDCASACVFLMNKYSDKEIINIGVGKDITIKALGELVKQAVGYRGETVYDASKPDGTPRKLVDTSRIASLGWKTRIALKEGVADTYAWYLQNVASPEAP